MESKDLIVREAIFEDCTYFGRWEALSSVTEFFTMDEGRTYEEVVTEFVRYRLDPSKQIYTITLKPEDKPIGKIVVTRINNHDDSLDITRIYIGDKELRSRGYGEQALHLLLEYAFLNLHMERVTIDHFTRNKCASYLYQKIGFQYEGVMRHAGKKDGKYIDLHLMSMLRAEYYNNIHTK